MAVQKDSDAAGLGVAAQIAPLDSLAAYAEAVPGYAESVQKDLDAAGLGDSDAGKALAAGAKGALSGLATGGAVSATVAGAALATGILATGAVALQAIPIAGTIAGAVLGIIAGLTAFFSGKAKAARAKYVEASNAAIDYMNCYTKAASLLPTQALRDAAGKLGESAQKQASNEWFGSHGIAGSIDDASITEDERIKRIERFKDPDYWNRVRELYELLPDQVKALTLNWVKQNQQVGQSRKRTVIGVAVAATVLLGTGLLAVYGGRKDK